MRTSCRALLVVLVAVGMRSAAATDAPPQPPAKGAELGARVQWEGRIGHSMREGEDSCFELYGPLDEWDFAIRRFSTSERFIACAFGYYDPALFAPGRRLRVEGNLSREETHLIAGQLYHLPLVGAAILTLLPERPIHYPPPYYWPSPFYDPYWPPPPFPYPHPYPRWRNW
jgi:outer membrane lipoprotein